MFDIGFWELLLIGIVTLLIVGPERLPGLARTCGLWVGKLKGKVQEAKDIIDHEIELDELKQRIKEVDKIEQGLKAKKLEDYLKDQDDA